MRNIHGAVFGPSVLCIALLTVSVALLFTMADVEALPNDPLRSLEITLEKEVGHLKPTNVEHGVCSMTGTVTIEKPSSADRVTVNLTGWASNNWTVTVTPSILSFDERGTKTFTTTVVVPPKWNASRPEDKDHLSVLAMANSPLWHDDESAYADLIIDQYFSIAVTSYNPTLRAEPDREVSGSIEVRNEGNGHDTVLIDIIEGGEYIHREDFESVIGMREFQSAGIIFAFTMREDIDPDLYGKTVTITFRVRSQTATDQGLVVEDHYTMSIYVLSEREQTSRIPWHFWLPIALISMCIIVPAAFLYRRHRHREFARRIAEIEASRR